MIKKIKWAPRNNMVILEARIKLEEKERKIKYLDSDGANYIDNYEYFVYDKGENVGIDLEFGDQIYCNLANIKFIHGTTDRKEELTYMMILDQLIDLRQPGPTNI